MFKRAVEAARAAYGPDAAVDPFRGLYLSEAQVTRILAHPPRGSFLPEDAPPVEPGWQEILAVEDNWRWLVEAYGLTEFDLDLMLIALAPEVDLRYERLCGYLQDDVSRKRPTVDLALNFLCTSAQEKLSRRAHFSSDSPLLRHHLVALISETGSAEPSILAHIVRLDGQIVDLLLKQRGLDRRLAAFSQLTAPQSVVGRASNLSKTVGSLGSMVRRTWGRTPLRVYFQGLRGTGRRQAAEAISAESGLNLLAVNLDTLTNVHGDFCELLYVVFREAWLQGAILYMDGIDALVGQASTATQRLLLDQLAQHPGITILAGQGPWIYAGREPLGVLIIPFALPGFTESKAIWEASLSVFGATLAANDLDALVGRFRLTPGQIADAVSTACNRTCFLAASETSSGIKEPAFPTVTTEELFAAARAQAGHDLASLARKIDPVYTWDDIVLPEEAMTQLHEICRRVVYRQRVLGEWGFGRAHSQGKGTSALFAGPPGTGKTMAAEVLAHELGLDLYKIDLSSVISKYIGETEKNLERIFAAATNANAILLFDEADALFGKRSEVRDSHDRYANIEIAYLLQRMEQHEGLAILATNLRQHMDEAFTRRLQFIVELPFPDEVNRRRIWQVLFPCEAPRSPEIDFDLLARRFRLSGGNIRNVVLGAAYLAAADDAPIAMSHLLQATHREHQKMGKVLSEVDLFGRGDDHG